MKQCTKCKKLKSKSEFSKNRKNKDGLRYWCKKCEREYKRRYYRRNRGPVKKYFVYEESHRTIDGLKQKRCTKCKKWKDESKFGKHRYSSKDGLSAWCKDCWRIYARERYNKEGKGLKKKYYIYGECHRVVEGVKQKLCTKCMRWKAESDFYKERRYKDGLRYVCIACMLAYAREHYNKEGKGLKKNII